MSFRIGLLFGLLVILGIILWFIPRDGFQNLNTSAPAPIMDREPIIYPARNIVSGGPSGPSQMPPPGEERMMSPEVAMDPYSQNEESASIPERLRHPERMFKPAPDNTTTTMPISTYMPFHLLLASNAAVCFCVNRAIDMTMTM
jgi:hypothetical protein